MISSRLRYCFLTVQLLLLISTSLPAQLPYEPPVPPPPNFQQSTLGVPHYGPARQASTAVAGPTTNNCEVQVRNLEETLGKDVGTSPWHMVSAPRYSRPDLVTIWGATLTDAYRFVVNGPRFEALDRFPLNYFPSSITWNLFSTDDGRVIVPDASGYKIVGQRQRSRKPSWLFLSDRNSAAPNSKIHLLDIMEFDEGELTDLLQPPAGARFAKLTAAGGSAPTYSGEMATTVSYLLNDVRYTYLIIVDIDEKRVVTGALIGEGQKSNEIAAEPVGARGTAFYVPLDETIVKMVYRPGTRPVRHWVAELPVRRRTGSTPTLVNTSDGRKFVCLIDSECAVSSITNGLIVCSEDARPSQLVSVDRTAPRGATPTVLTTPLPRWLRTVENSPAALGDRIVVANYSGYLPNGLLVPAGGRVDGESTPRWLTSPDAQPDFATGIVTLKYNPTTGNFEVDWADADRQVSCIPTISAGSNMVYGTGSEEATGKSYLYGFQLADGPSGTGKGSLRLRVPVGEAAFRTPERDRRGHVIFPKEQYKTTPGEFFDAGNQVILLPDGSLVLAGGRSLVRVRERR